MVIYVHLTSHCAYLTVVQGIAKDHSEVGTVASEMHRYYHRAWGFLTTWPLLSINVIFHWDRSKKISQNFILHTFFSWTRVTWAKDPLWLSHSGPQRDQLRTPCADFTLAQGANISLCSSSEIMTWENLQQVKKSIMDNNGVWYHTPLKIFKKTMIMGLCHVFGERY